MKIVDAAAKQLYTVLIFVILITSLYASHIQLSAVQIVYFHLNDGVYDIVDIEKTSTDRSRVNLYPYLPNNKW